MSLFALDKELIFPPVHLAEPDGLLAFGGDLSRERLLLAYRSGIFPWYEGRRYFMVESRSEVLLLLPETLRVSKSMHHLLKKNVFAFTINNAFHEVISNCKTISRNKQESTWITNEVKKAYIDLHEAGYAHSAEAWLNGELVGGLYGIRLGKMFFGESMFSKVSNASKYAFIRYVQQLQSEGVELIDCQVYTEHLESLGARMMDRQAFIKAVARYC